MTKRTFVLFFCLAQFLASLLFAQETAACKLDLARRNFAPFSVEKSDKATSFFLVDQTIPRSESIVRSDEFGWQESLSDMMLRHRHTSFRFNAEVSQLALDYHITQVPKVIRETIQLPTVARGAFVLPDYYGFLHRLCPF